MQRAHLPPRPGRAGQLDRGRGRRAGGVQRDPEVGQRPDLAEVDGQRPGPARGTPVGARVPVDRVRRTLARLRRARRRRPGQRPVHGGRQARAPAPGACLPRARVPGACLPRARLPGARLPRARVPGAGLPVPAFPALARLLSARACAAGPAAATSASGTATSTAQAAAAIRGRRPAATTRPRYPASRDEPCGRAGAVTGLVRVIGSLGLFIRFPFEPTRFRGQVDSFARVRTTGNRLPYGFPQKIISRTTPPRARPCPAARAPQPVACSAWPAARGLQRVACSAWPQRCLRTVVGSIPWPVRAGLASAA